MFGQKTPAKTLALIREPSMLDAIEAVGVPDTDALVPRASRVDSAGEAESGQALDHRDEAGVVIGVVAIRGEGFEQLGDDG